MFLPTPRSERNIPHSRNKRIVCSPGTPSGFAVVGKTSLVILLDSLWILCATSTILVYKYSVCPVSFVVTIALVLEAGHCWQVRLQRCWCDYQPKNAQHQHCPVGSVSAISVLCSIDPFFKGILVEVVHMFFALSAAIGGHRH